MGLWSKTTKETSNQPQSPADLMQSLRNEFRKTKGITDSGTFKNVYHLLDRLADTNDLDARQQICGDLIASCQKYLQKNEEDVSKQPRKDLIERTADLGRYFACETAYQRIGAMDNTPVSLESAMEITKRATEFDKAYDAFRKAKNRNLFITDVRDDLDKKHQENELRNLNGVRDVKKLNEIMEKNPQPLLWKNVSTPQYIIKADEAIGKVSNGQSIRQIVEVNGEKGIFSEYLPETREEIVFDMISSLPPGETKSKMQQYINEIRECAVGTDRLGSSQDIVIADVMTRFCTNLDAKRAKFGDQVYSELKELAKDPDVQNTLGSIGSAFRAQFSMHDAAHGRDIDTVNGGLDKRHMLTSRVADMLGIGHMIAHSQEIQTVRNGKIVRGNFMEFAKGIDVKTKSREEFDDLTNASIDSPGLLRDANRLSVFDYLCGQTDRHSGNIFYTLGDKGPDGKRPITGIMGIDNDMAFISQSLRSSNNKDIVQPELLPVMDRELTEQIMGLDRQKLEFLTGDVISPEELDKMEERLNEIKQACAGCRQLSKEEWDIRNLNSPEDQKKLQDYKNLQKGTYESIRTRNMYLNQNKYFGTSPMTSAARAAQLDADAVQKWEEKQASFFGPTAEAPKREAAQAEASKKEAAAQPAKTKMDFKALQNEHLRNVQYKESRYHMGRAIGARQAARTAPERQTPAPQREAAENTAPEKRGWVKSQPSRGR